MIPSMKMYLLNKHQKLLILISAAYLCALFFMRHESPLRSYSWEWMLITLPIWLFWGAVWILGWNNVVQKLRKSIGLVSNRKKEIGIASLIIWFVISIAYSIYDSNMEERRTAHKNIYHELMKEPSIISNSY